MKPRVEESLVIPGLYYVRAERVPDQRGFFSEVWRKEWVPGAREWVQQNRGGSGEGVLRGLHVHARQRDLWRCERGRIFCAFVDLRQRAGTIAAETYWLDDPSVAVYIPEGVAHGYCVPVGSAVLSYQVDRYYDSDDEHALSWRDPAVMRAVHWPTLQPILSPRDARAPMLADFNPLLLQSLRDLLPR